MSQQLTGYQKTLHAALEGVKGIEKFAAGERFKDAPLPQLTVQGVGQLAFPLLPEQKQVLVARSTQAPFGRGADTVVDTSVRLCRQIEAECVQLSQDWDVLVQEQARKFCCEMEVPGTVEARLYKLVLYEQGGFFKTHKDTEKEPGMFGSLVVQLPSRHDGGQLIVRHRGKQVQFDWGGEQSASFFYGAAFYADCEHELRPVENGARLCLLYNLVRTGVGPVPQLAVQTGGITERLRVACRDWEKELGHAPIVSAARRIRKNSLHGLEFHGSSSNAQVSSQEGLAAKPLKLAILLDHEYTEANLLFRNLKGRDLETANSLRQSGQFEIHLALITRHKSGGAEYSGRGRGRWGRRGRYCDSESEESAAHHEMVDVYDDCIEIKKLVDERDQAVMRHFVDLDPDTETLDGKPLFAEDDKIDREEYEGYTGNAGPHVDYWYFRACVVIWPRSFSLKIACSAGIGSAIRLARLRLAQAKSESGSEADARESLLETVREVWKFTKAQDYCEKIKYLVDLLEVATELKDLSSAFEILDEMSKPSPSASKVLDERSDDIVDMMPDFFSDGPSLHERGHGLSGPSRVQACLSALETFGWASLGPKVFSLVRATPDEVVDHPVQLALALHSGGGPPKFGVALRAEATEIALCVAQRGRSCLKTAAKNCAGSFCRMLFTFPECAQYRGDYLGCVAEGGPPALLSVMETLAGMVQAGELGERGTAGSSKPDASAESGLPEGFARLVSEYCAAALEGSEAAAEVNSDGAIKCFHILLQLPGSLELQKTFSQAACKHRSGTLLKGLTQALLQMPAQKLAEAPSNPHLQGLVEARAKQLRYEKPAPSNRQPHAEVLGHTDLTAFFRGDQQHITYTGIFSGIAHARNFAAKHGHGAGSYNPSEKTSATWVPGGIGRKAYVVITKTDAVFRELLKLYDADQEELRSLQPFLAAPTHDCDEQPLKRIKH